LNHGYDGGAGAWYDGNPEKTGKMLAEKLRNELTADVYIMGIVKNKDNDSRVFKQHSKGYVDKKYDAGNDRYTDGNGNGIKKQEVGLAGREKNPITAELNHDSKGRLIYDEVLMGVDNAIDSVRGELADFEVVIKKLDWNGKADYSEGYYTETKVDTFLDFNKNIVILFDAVDNVGYHSAVYEEFNAVLDTVSYAYLSVNGFLPKYNLVGHSRGGVVNLMYATWHPYNVENLISIDTPYYGLRYADIFDIEVLFDLHDFLYSTPLMDTIRNGGGQDFINLRESDRLRTEWNNMLANNPTANINALALGTAASAEFLIEGFKPLSGEFHDMLAKSQKDKIKDEENADMRNAARNAAIDNIFKNIKGFASDVINNLTDIDETFEEFKDDLSADPQTDMTDISDDDIWMCALNYIIEEYMYGFVNFTMDKSFYSLIDGTDPNLGALPATANISENELYQTIESWGIDMSWLNDLIGEADEASDAALEKAGKVLFLASAALYLGGTIGAAEIIATFVPSAVIGFLIAESSENILAGALAFGVTGAMIGLVLGLVDIAAVMVVSQVVDKLDPLFGFYEGEFVLKTDLFIDLYSQLAPEYDGFERETKIFKKDNFDTDLRNAGDERLLLHNFANLDQDILGGTVKRITDSGTKAYESAVFTTTTTVEDKIVITGINGLYTDTLIIPEILNGKSVSAIADNAFVNQNGLKTVIIMPASLSIGEGAFLGCTALESVSFYGLTTQEKVITIPEKVQIGSGAFSDCLAINEFKVSESNAYHTVIGGVLYNKNVTSLICYPSGKTNESFTLPSEVLELGNYSLVNNAELKNIDLQNVSNIGNGVFSGCINLTAITANNLQYIAGSGIKDTLWYKNNSDDYVALGSVLIAYNGYSNEIVLSEEYSAIGSEAFSNAANLTIIYIKAVDFVVQAGQNVLEGSNVQKIYIPKMHEQEYLARLNWNPYREVFDVKNVSVELDLGYGGLSDFAVLKYGWFFDIGAPVREGFTFKYWYDDTEKQYTEGDRWLVFDDDVTLCAEWTPNTYTLFYSVDGSLTMFQGNNVIYSKTIGESLALDINEIKNMPTPIHTDSNFAFSHWSDAPNGEAIYNEETEYLIADNLTLYGVFERVSYTVKYSNYDDSRVIVIYKTDDEFTFINPGERTGYAFDAWYNDSDYTMTATAPNVNGETTYYAKWDFLYTIRFKNGENECAVITETAEKISSVTMPVLNKSGYKGYWKECEIYDDKSAKTIDFGATGYNYPTDYPESVTLIAVWTEKNFSESYNSSTGCYELYFAKQLAGMSGTGNVRLMRDVSLKDFSNWIPIPYFSGTFDGCGFTISNLNISKSVSGAVDSTEYYGLFAMVSGTIKNFNMTNVNIYYASSAHSGSGTVYAGAVAGYQKSGHIQSVTVAGNIACHRQQSAVGGIFGYASGSIYSCTSNVQIGGNGDMGGIAGYTDSATLYNCNVTDSVISLYVAYVNRSVGGIIGCAANNTTILISNVIGTVIKFIGYGGLAGEKLVPSMGIIVGHLNKSVLYMGNMSGSYIDTGSLTSSFKYGLFNLFKHNQKQDVGNGSGQSYGNTSGSCSVYY
jgi:uncharacterized repeat protein (TIGR02543 family)